MKIMVVFDPYYGNTEQVARAVGGAVGSPWMEPKVPSNRRSSGGPRSGPAVSRLADPEYKLEVQSCRTEEEKR